MLQQIDLLGALVLLAALVLLPLGLPGAPAPPAVEQLGALMLLTVELLAALLPVELDG